MVKNAYYDSQNCDALLKIFWLQLSDPEIISTKYHLGKLQIYDI